jgi:putative DNA primase/helicase
VLSEAGREWLRDHLDDIPQTDAGDIPLPPEPADEIPIPDEPSWAPGDPDAAEPPDEPAVPQMDTPVGHSGQVRMAYRLQAAYHDQLLHVHGIGWHTWDGKRWAYDDVGASKRAVLDVLQRALAQSFGDKKLRRDIGSCESNAGIQGVLAIAAALTPFAATVRDLDADPYLLNCANGTLDLRTLELRPHSPADRITRICRGAYRRPDAKSDVWETFLARVLPDEDVRGFLQRIVGVGLVGKVIEHLLVIMTGVGANGKSVFDKSIRFALGDYACTAEPDLFMHRENAHPTGEMDLLGRRLVVVSESEKDRRLAEATMKRLTGGDTIRARRMRQDFIEFTPSHTALLITNHLPRVSGDDAAIWRRIRVAPFDVVIPEDERDGDLDTKLELEADAVLTWAVQGWADYQDRGLDEPDAVLVATGDYRKASDAVARFIDECCLTGSPVNKATTGQLFDAWEKWRVTDGAEQISQKAFGMAVTAKGFPASEKSINGKKWRQGIALKSTDDNGD